MCNKCPDLEALNIQSKEEFDQLNFPPECKYDLSQFASTVTSKFKVCSPVSPFVSVCLLLHVLLLVCLASFFFFFGLFVSLHSCLFLFSCVYFTCLVVYGFCLHSLSYSYTYNNG